MLASPLDPFDPMDRAFQQLGERVPRRHRAPPHGTGSSSASTRCPRTCWRSPTCGAHRTDADYVIAAKGAPEAIADLCHLPDVGARPRSTTQVETAANAGLRVLAVARAKFTATAALPTEQHDFDFEYLGLVGAARPRATRRCRRRRQLPPRRHPGRDDHRRLPGHRALGRPRRRPRHLRRRHHRPRAHDDERRRTRPPSAERSTCSPAWSPSRSSSSSARSRPTARSSA